LTSLPSFSFSRLSFSSNLAIFSSLATSYFYFSLILSLSLLFFVFSSFLVFSSSLTDLVNFLISYLDSSSIFLYFLSSSLSHSFSCLNSSIFVSNSRICSLFSSSFLMIYSFCFISPDKNCLSSPAFLSSYSTEALSFSISSLSLISSRLNSSFF
jgi:hypothetical protein